MRTHTGHLGGRLATIVAALACTAVVATASTALADPASASASARTAHSRLPLSVDGGAWQSGHVQGMAIDRRKGFMYFSMTNLLVKTDLRGNPVGSVTGFTGHLGDLDFDEKDGRVYGSLEYKEAKSFYIAILDVDRITRMNMDAQSTGVVSTVYLKEVVKDFTADMNGDGVFDGDTGNTPTTATAAAASTASPSVRRSATSAASMPRGG